MHGAADATPQQRKGANCHHNSMISTTFHIASLPLPRRSASQCQAPCQACLQRHPSSQATSHCEVSSIGQYPKPRITPTSQECLHNCLAQRQDRRFSVRGIGHEFETLDNECEDTEFSGTFSPPMPLYTRHHAEQRDAPRSRDGNHRY